MDFFQISLKLLGVIYWAGFFIFLSQGKGWTSFFWVREVINDLLDRLFPT